MAKRKQRAPKFVDAAKRQQLEWNMHEMMGSSSSFTSNISVSQHNSAQVEADEYIGASNVSADNSGNNFTSQTPLHALRVDAFYQNLASCHSILTLLSKDYTRFNKQNHCESSLRFGSFKVTLMPHCDLTPLPDQLPEFNECWLYLASNDKPHMLYFEMSDENTSNLYEIVSKKGRPRMSKFGIFWFASINVPMEVISRLQTKMFWVCNFLLLFFSNNYDKLFISSLCLTVRDLNAD